MVVHVSWWVLFQVFCLVQGLTTSAYLLARGGRRDGQPWLGLLVLGLTLQVADYMLASSGTYFRHRAWYFTPLFFSWCYGPLLWAAVRSRYGDGRAPAWGHFGPGAVQLGFYLVLAAQSLATKAWFWQHIHKPVTRYIEYYGAVLLVGLYIGLALRLVRAHRPRPRWVTRGLWGVVAFYGLAALDPLLNQYYLPAGAPKFYLTSLLLPVLAYAAALLGWLKGSPANQPAQPVVIPAPPRPTIQAELVEPLTASEDPAPPPRALPDPAQVTRLVRVMETEALYRDPELSLHSLARHLELPPNTVSHLLNAGLGQTFTEWVNGCRLAEVERRLGTPDATRFTLLALALDAGFNSKTTFNRVFKERNGLTPSQYQKKYHPTLRDDAAPASH